MLDVNDFIVERGGNPDRIRESQRRRFADEGIVDEIITLFEDHRKSTSREDYTRHRQGLTLDSQKPITAPPKSVPR